MPSLCYVVGFLRVTSNLNTQQHLKAVHLGYPVHMLLQAVMLDLHSIRAWAELLQLWCFKRPAGS
jgi:hypothetical protein